MHVSGPTKSDMIGFHDTKRSVMWRFAFAFLMKHKLVYVLEHSEFYLYAILFLDPSHMLIYCILGGQLDWNYMSRKL